MNKLLVVLLSCFCLSAFAATPATKAAPDGSKMIEKRLDHMQKKLELTADQRSQLQGIYQDEWQQQKQLRDNTKTKVDAVLTPAQQAKLDKQKAKRHEKMRDKHHERMHQHKDKDHGHD